MNSLATSQTAGQPLKFSDLRRLVSDMVAKGCTVDIHPDGSVRVTPSTSAKPADPFDFVDMAR